MPSESGPACARARSLAISRMRAGASTPTAGGSHSLPHPSPPSSLASLTQSVSGGRHIPEALAAAARGGVVRLLADEAEGGYVVTQREARD